MKPSLFVAPIGSANPASIHRTVVKQAEFLSCCQLVAEICKWICLHNNVAHIAKHDSVVIVPTFLHQALLGPEEAADQEMGVGCAESKSPCLFDGNGWLLHQPLLAPPQPAFCAGSQFAGEGESASDHMGRVRHRFQAQPRKHLEQGSQAPEIVVGGEHQHLGCRGVLLKRVEQWP